MKPWKPSLMPQAHLHRRSFPWVGVAIVVAFVAVIVALVLGQP